MSKALLLLAAAAAGGAGGVLGATLIGPASPAPVTEAASGLGGPAGASAAEDDRVKGLESEIASLYLALDMLRQDFVVQGRTELVPTRPTSQPAAGDLAAAEFEGGDVDWGAALDQRVAAVIEARDEAERKARDERREEQRVKQLEERMQRLQADLGLDNYQTAELGKILGDADLKRREMFESMQNMRDGGNFDRDSIRQMMETVRTDTNARAASLLSPAQMAKFETSNAFGGFGRDFGGGNRGGGANGGGRRGG
ncbi:MAG TPA: hypothetical protein VGC54_05760 [Planctomycetota bacterium]